MSVIDIVKYGILNEPAIILSSDMKLSKILWDKCFKSKVPSEISNNSR